MACIAYYVARVRASHQILPAERQDLCLLSGARVLSPPQRAAVSNALQHHRLPPDTRDLIAASLKGQVFLPAGQVQLEAALDYGGLAVLNDGWSRFRLGELLAGIRSARQRGLLQATIYSRLLFPCAKLSLAQKAQGTWLAQACGLEAKES